MMIAKFDRTVRLGLIVMILAIGILASCTGETSASYTEGAQGVLEPLLSRK
jgi:hypothetical protein